MPAPRSIPWSHRRGWVCLAMSQLCQRSHQNSSMLERIQPCKHKETVLCPYFMAQRGLLVAGGFTVQSQVACDSPRHGLAGTLRCRLQPM